MSDTKEQMATIIEALEHSKPTHAYYHKPVKRHADALAYARALAARQPGAQVPVAQVRQNGGHTSPEVWFYPETFYGTKIPDGADLFLGPPAQGIDLEQFRERIKAAIDRIVNHRGLMRIPVDNTDPDIVLADILHLIDSQRDAARCSAGVPNG